MLANPAIAIDRRVDYYEKFFLTYCKLLSLPR